MAVTWQTVPLHFVDFEGGPASGILEFGVVSTLGGRIRTVRTALCRGRRPPARQEVEVHRIRERDLVGAGDFEDERGYFQGLRDTGLLAAHFASAENYLLKSVWPYPRAAPDWLRSERRVADWGPWIDTGRLAENVFGHGGSLKLKDLVVSLELADKLDLLAVEHCPGNRRFFHAALYDALASFLVFRRLVESLNEDDLAALLTIAAADATLREGLRQPDLFD